MTTDTDTLVARLREPASKIHNAKGGWSECVDDIQRMKAERSEAANRIEALTAENATLRNIAAGEFEIVDSAFMERAKVAEAERDAWKANAVALAIRLRHHEEYAWAARWTDKPFQPSETLATHEALMKGGA